MTVPPPRASPAPPDPGPEEDSKARRLKRRQPESPWIARVKIGVISAFLGAGGEVGWKIFEKLDVVNTAMAQTKSTADQALEEARTAKRAVEIVDAGTAAKLERVERKIDAVAENTDKKLTDMQVTLNAILREQRAKR